MYNLVRPVTTMVIRFAFPAAALFALLAVSMIRIVWKMRVLRWAALLGLGSQNVAVVWFCPSQKVKPQDWTTSFMIMTGLASLSIMEAGGRSQTARDGGEGRRR